MKTRSKFGVWLCGLALGTGLGLSCAAAQRLQNPAPTRQQTPPPQSRPPQREANPPAQRNTQPAPRDNRPPQRNERPGGSYHPQDAPRRGGNENRRPTNEDQRRLNERRNQGYDNRPRDDRYQRPPAASPNYNPNRPPQATSKPFKDLSPDEKRRVLDDSRKFNRLSPQKQQEMRQAFQTWQRMTPEQREHIQNDILPRWKQMSPDRQNAIQHRLGVLKNMPESARNRHLNDPNFTRGMSEEDKEMLRDLSHQHVGAAQEQARQPNEQ